MLVIVISHSFACTVAAIQQMIRRSRFEYQLNRNQMITENPMTSLPAIVRASRIAAKLAKSAKISVSLIFGLLLKSVGTVYILLRRPVTIEQRLRYSVVLLANAFSRTINISLRQLYNNLLRLVEHECWSILDRFRSSAASTAYIDALWIAYR